MDSPKYLYSQKIDKIFSYKIALEINNRRGCYTVSLEAFHYLPHKEMRIAKETNTKKLGKLS